jgi:hypothetical protein
METFVAVVFASQGDADAFQTALLGSEGIDVKRCGVYGRNAYGDLSLQGPETDAEDVLDMLTVPPGSQQEAKDELDEALPAGSCALLALISESDPSAVDELARAHGGTVYRRTAASLETSGYRRFTDATRLD